eukprot:gene3756-biopygen3793
MQGMCRAGACKVHARCIQGASQVHGRYAEDAPRMHRGPLRTAAATRLILLLASGADPGRPRARVDVVKRELERARGGARDLHCLCDCESALLQHAVM